MDRFPKKPKKQEDLWLMSFSDLSLVLMCFFVLLLSMSTVNKKRFEHIKDHINADKPDATKRNLEHLFQRIRSEIKRKRLTRYVQARYDHDGIHVDFQGGILFAPGSAKANQKFEPIVQSVLEIIAAAPDKYDFIIEGHTDDTKLRSSVPGRGNWELSAARAFAIVRTFGTQGVEERRMSVAAYADTRPKVEITDLSGEALKAARAANRRIVISIE